MSQRIYEAAAELLRRGGRGAVVTIVETTGSTPRKAGAKMLVDENGRVTGTVGGGCVEADLFAFAREVMRTGRVATREIDLSARSADENDMLCGGRIRVMIEPVIGDEKLVILGAGHISRALHDVCRGLDLLITVTDDRPQFATAERFPAAHRVVAAPFAEQFARLDIDANTCVVIVTRGHENDELCMEMALRTPAKHIALVGSRTKAALFRAHLREKGFTDGELARVRCPAGLDIGAETPEEIALSIAAELVAVRRGKWRGDAETKTQPAHDGS
jgi:xanthine dehydrogenase accessory factor